MKKKKRQRLGDDPVVAEVRRTREAIAKRFNYDIDAIFAHFEQKTEEARRNGFRVASPGQRPSRKAG